MFPNSVAVKKTALAALKNEWPTAMAAVTIPLVFYLIMINVFSLLEYIFAVPVALVTVRILLIFVMIFIGLPLSLGALRILWGIETDASLKISEVFHYFSSVKAYKRVFNFIVLLFGGMILKSVALLLPSYIIDLISNSSSGLFANTAMPLWVDNLWVFAAFLRIIAVCCIIYVALRYYLAPFIFVANDGADPFECVHKSYTVSRVSVGNFVGLMFSLTGWILLSLFFIPMVFTLPYMSMCYLMHSRFSAVFYNKKVEKYERGGEL